jgi:tetratricopeptide (TPR) repeat protein
MTGNSLQSTFAQAIDFHRVGRLAEAESLYRKILATSPEHAEAMHHLGIIALQCNQPAEALQLIGRSIVLAPSAAAMNNLGEALRAVGRVNEAIESYRKAIAIDARQVDAMANMGLALTALKQIPDAEKILRQAISIAPNHVPACIGFANLLNLTERHDDTVAAWERVVRLVPAQPVYHLSLGTAWIRAGDPYRAINSIRRAIELQPKNAESHAKLAMAYDALNKTQEAITAAREAVALAEGQWQAHHDLATYLQKAGSSAEAVESFDKAIKLNPNNASLYGARAKSMMNVGRMRDSAESLRQGIALSPSDARMYSALSAVRFAERDFPAAVEAAEAALRLDSHSVDAHASLAFALLASGRFEEGFKEYEWRWRDATFTTKPRDFEQPLWDGSDPRGRTILVHCEQGFGDIFQFMRYVPMVRAKGARVIFEVSYKVANLARRMSMGLSVVITGTMLPNFDLHVPLMSLPAIFGTRAQNIPAPSPYLSADPALAAQWKRRLISANSEPADNLIVGLVWGGSAKPDPKRSAKLAELAPLGAIPGVSLIAMQTEPQSVEANDPPPGMKLLNLGPELRDFADTTASVLANLDLLITIDTGVAHLAGAMGIPTWILLPFAPDWRWVLDESVSAWYPTARLFRQTPRDDWGPVVERVAKELGELRRSSKSVEEDIRRSQPDSIVRPQRLP